MKVSKNYVKLQPTKDGYFKVLEDYYPFTDKSILIPKNYVTNGANIPRMFWSIIPPFFPKYLNAVVVHDYYCDLDYYDEADEYFEKLLFSVEVSYKTKSMVTAVKYYHNIKYKNLPKFKKDVIILLQIIKEYYESMPILQKRNRNNNKDYRRDL